MQGMLSSLGCALRQAVAVQDDVMAQLESLRNIPPHNPGATAPEDAYR